MEAPAALSPSTKIQPGESESHASTNSPEVIKVQESTVRKFAALLCSNSEAASPFRSRGLNTLLADSTADDSVILTLPSLDLRLSEHADGASALPKIGEKKNIQGDEADVRTQESRPMMTASVLAAAVDTSRNETEIVTNHTSSTSWTKSTLMYASHALATNLSDFFSNLIDSRVKAWTLLLLRHSLSTGDTESRARLLGMLSASISVNKAETTFKTLSMPSSAAGQRKEADVILPLLFEVCIHLSIQDKPSTVKLLAPGTISADFAETRLSVGSLKRVLIRLDTGVMLSSMVDQARLIVFKAVANVTKAKLPPSLGIAPPKDVPEEIVKGKAFAQNLAPPRTDTSVAGIGAKLSGFKSAMSLTTNPATDKSPTLQKAQNSALRLNSILLGKSQNSSAQLGLRKTRSVMWNSPAQLPTIPAPLATKKQRMAETAARLTSIKSFGRPHGGDFGSGPRNATFGEYGHVQMWGRDGRLAHHPSPLQTQQATDDYVGLTGIVERNATFDLSRTSVDPKVLGTASALPRTATGLENWLLKTSTPGR